MKIPFPRWWYSLALVAAAALFLGCDDGEQKADKETAKASPTAKKTELGKNVFLETDGDQRRVLINATVCMREGPLEQLLCKKATKEHEAILAADMDAKLVHAGLIAAGAEPGSPVKFQPQYTAPRGTVIKIYLQYESKGKTIKIPAQQWIKNRKTKKDLDQDWVFAGSALFPNREDPKGPPHYGANEGDVICVRNMDLAMLDLPSPTSMDYDDLDFEAFTERIPGLNTPVLVILEPVLGAKK